MQILKTKKSLMAFAALQIAIFHLWIPVLRASSLPGQIERFFVTTAYIGVDLFFFLSAYTLSFSDISSKRKFLNKRFSKIYPVFLLFCVAALIKGKFTLSGFLLTAIGLDFLRHGGSSFLWFVPALLIMYLVFPFIKVTLSKFNQAKQFLISLLVWAALTFAVEYGLRGLIDISIFLCRVPAILLGVFLSKYEDTWTIKHRVITGTLLFLPGLILIYQFGYYDRLTVPFEGMFYITALPCILGLIFLLDLIWQNHSSRAIEAIGGATLEMYCLQILIGSELVSTLFRLTHNKILTNLLSLTILILCSLALAWGISAARKLIFSKNNS